MGVYCLIGEILSYNQYFQITNEHGLLIRKYIRGYTKPQEGSYFHPFNGPLVSLILTVAHTSDPFHGPNWHLVNAMGLNVLEA